LFPGYLVREVKWNSVALSKAIVPAVPPSSEIVVTEVNAPK
jgi:hypothetical protein